MKKILYIIFATVLCTHIATAQTALMTDEDHRIMMNDYAVNLNTVLTANCPQGMTIDQFKKKIVNGELTLSSTAQASILTYAEPLKTYGTQFATAKNITATTDAEKIFLSSFAPSTVVDGDGNLVESATGGLTGVDIWDRAVEICASSGCAPFAVVSESKESVNVLTKAVANKLTINSGALGVAIMISNFDKSFSRIVYLKKMAFNLSENQNFISVINRLDMFINRPNDHVKATELLAKINLNDNDRLELASSLGFLSIEEAYLFDSNMYEDFLMINANFEIENLMVEEQYVVIFNAINFKHVKDSYFARPISSICKNINEQCKFDAKTGYMINTIGCIAAGIGIASASFWCAGCLGAAAGSACVGFAILNLQAKMSTCKLNLELCLTTATPRIIKAKIEPLKINYKWYIVNGYGIIIKDYN